MSWNPLKWAFLLAANHFWEQQQVMCPDTDLVFKKNSPETPQRTAYEILIWDERYV